MLTPTCPAPRRIWFKTPERFVARARALLDELRSEPPARNEDDAARGNPLDVTPHVPISYRGLVDAFAAGLGGDAVLVPKNLRACELPPEGTLRRIRALVAELPTPTDFAERVRVDAARWLYASFTTAPRCDPAQAAFWAGYALSEGGRTVRGCCGRPLQPGERVCRGCAYGGAPDDGPGAMGATSTLSPP